MSSSRLKTWPDGGAVGLELEHFAGHGFGEAVDAGDAVADLDDLTDLGDFQLGGVTFDFLLDDAGDFVGFDFHSGLLRNSGQVAE